jgi:hypothetical protein
MSSPDTTDHSIPGETPEDRIPVEAAFQKTLLPVEVLTTHTANLGSADLKVIVEGRDGKHYAVKTLADGKGKVPASELFCYELAYRVVLPTPSYSFIAMPSGELAFGSVWEGGVINGNKQIAYPAFIDSVLKGTIPVANLKRFFSRLYAFDLFVNNVDRHWGNYLWRTSYGDSIIALAFDFSRACFEIGHEGFEATQPNTKTQMIFSLLNVSKNYVKSDAIDCLESIRNIPTEDIEAMLSNFPAEWMPEKDKKSYIKWWDSTARNDRINALMKFL